MVRRQRIMFIAALLIGVGIATQPSIGWATPPGLGQDTLPGSLPSALPASLPKLPPGVAKMLPKLVEKEFLAPLTDYMRLGLDVLKQVERHANKWHKLKEKMAAKLDKIVPKEGPPSGGVRQLHPLRGTFLIREDYAQQTLEEDWFLKPSFGTAALHLDVPFDADVKVTQLLAKKRDNQITFEPVSTSVRSRGRYRHLVLHNVPQGNRREVKVEASVWTKDAKCDAGMTTVCKKVALQAGDRRHLTFPKQDFLAMVPPAAPFIAMAVPAATPATPPPATSPSGVKFEDKDFPYDVTDPKTKKKVKALLAEVKYGASGGTAESFTFVSAGKLTKAYKVTPDKLTLIHEPIPPVGADSKAEYELELTLTWKTKSAGPGEAAASERSTKIKAPAKVKFTYDAKTKRGTTTVDFAGKSAMAPPAATTTKETTVKTTTKSATQEKTQVTTTKELPPAPAAPTLDLRGRIEKDLPGELPKADSPAEITVTATLKHGDLILLKVDNEFKIIVVPK